LDGLVWIVVNRLAKINVMVMEYVLNLVYVNAMKAIKEKIVPKEIVHLIAIIEDLAILTLLNVAVIKVFRVIIVKMLIVRRNV
jgi:hypothetical protein